MTLLEIAENVLIQVSGGHLTHDLNVHRADILSYLRSAIPKYNIIGLRERRSEARQDLAFGLASDWSTGSFWAVLTPEVKFDEITNRRYVDLPGFVQSLPNDRGIQAIYPKANPIAQFVRATSPAALIGTERIWGNMVFFYTIPVDGVTRIMLFNLTEDCPVEVIALMDPEAIGDEDQAPIIPEMIEPLIDHTIEHFLQTRGTPADKAIDAADNNQK